MGLTAFNRRRREQEQAEQPVSVPDDLEQAEQPVSVPDDLEQAEQPAVDAPKPAKASKNANPSKPEVKE
jgi:hypothetical protein